jgi:hypothetical protein
MRPLNGQQFSRGIRGETRMVKELCGWRDLGMGDFCRPDFLWVPHPDAVMPPFLIEVKDQDAFEPPPFAGHGLKCRQFDVYMAAFEKNGLMTWLTVNDAGAGKTYGAYLHWLAAGESFVTNSPEPRIVFPLDSFKEKDLR